MFNINCNNTQCTILTSLLLMGRPYLNKLSGSLFTRVPDPLAISLALAMDEAITSLFEAMLGNADVIGPASVAGAIQRAAARAIPDTAPFTVASTASSVSTTMFSLFEGFVACKMGTLDRD